jgi:VWFA-related protein
MSRAISPWLISSLVLAAFGPTLSRADDGPTPAEVDAAIARGVAFLKEEQQARGEWRYNFNHDHTLGITALAGLALLENGVEPTDRAVARAEAVVEQLAGRSDQTYDLALAILFLARVQKGQSGPNDALIRRLAGRLAGGSDDGFWTYTVPLRGGNDDRPAPTKPRRRLRSVARVGDNSNTQFALLGLWAAGRHGFDPNAALESIDGHFRGSQDPEGRWGYVPGDAGREAMTCAGLMGLAIAAARPALAERQTARARGAALAADPVFTAALRAVSRDARSIGGGSDIYYLWSLERVCVALGLRDLDGLDWYSVGARELLRRQRGDGGWSDERWGRLPNTCLALLFLRKANLAFELDRVLKLPGAPRATGPNPSEPSEPEGPRSVPAEGPDGDATVIVTGASDAAFPEISVDFEVKRPDGSFVVDAIRDDFRVTEEGVAVPVLRLQAPTTREARPITVVLVVDRSRSMEEEDRIGSLKRAVATFLNGLPKGSRVAVVAFGSEVEQVCPFTGDFPRVQAAVDQLTPAGATRYYDAVAGSLDLIARESGRRAVLALTDGEDTFSQDATLDTVIASARRLGLPVHTLGLGSEDEIESDSLRRLARSTRGQYYPVRQADQLRSIYEQLAARLRSSYTLVYQTDRKIPDGTLRPVRISYRSGRKSGETAVFIPGMVVPAAGWSPLFLVLVAVLSVLAVAPGWLSRRAGTSNHQPGR